MKEKKIRLKIMHENFKKLKRKSYVAVSFIPPNSAL